MIKIEDYGKYKRGMTGGEIKQYLKERAQELGLKGYKTISLWSKFCKIAGPGNTMAIETTDCCKKEIGLMYRSDVERFADVMFLNKPTYFD